MGIKISCISVGDIRTNCYLGLDKSGNGFLVDPGGEAEKILNLLSKENNLKLKYILLTHAHYDHVLALDTIKEAYPKADIILAENDLNFLRMVPEQGIFEKKFLGPIKSEVVSVSEGDFLPFGEENIRVIETPGHTPGGACYQIEGYLFSGDTLFYHTIGRTDLPGASKEKMATSLDKLLRLDEKIKVLPGHGESTTIMEEKKFWGRAS
jgi:glyoxylase-like metal-dependent hydrolase (beta-lactamase superfamily II)